eukprot:2862311-Amphidinium_carterae.1
MALERQGEVQVRLAQTARARRPVTQEAPQTKTVEGKATTIRIRAAKPAAMTGTRDLFKLRLQAGSRNARRYGSVLLQILWQCAGLICCHQVPLANLSNSRGASWTLRT